MTLNPDSTPCTACGAPTPYTAAKTCDTCFARARGGVPTNLRKAEGDPTETRGHTSGFIQEVPVEKQTLEVELRSLLIRNQRLEENLSAVQTRCTELVEENRKLKLRSIAGLCKVSSEIAKSKGWHDTPRSFGDICALLHSEVSEALEEYRNGEKVDDHFYEVTLRYDNGVGTLKEKWSAEEVATRSKDGFVSAKPCGIPSELADVVIRVCEFCGTNGIDLEGAIAKKTAFNLSREIRHGGKKL